MTTHDAETALTAALADRDFTAALDRGDAAAHARLAELNAAAYGRSWNPARAGSPLAPPAPEPAAAQGEIKRLGADPGFLDALGRGDPDASATWERLHRQGYPEPDAAPAGYSADPTQGFHADAATSAVPPSPSDYTSTTRPGPIPGS